MKPNFVTKRLSWVKRAIATTLLCLSALTFVWQGAFSTTVAMAAPTANWLIATDLGNQVQGKVREDTGRAKSFVQDAKEKVKETANKNAQRVEEATDDNGSFLERKAKKDTARIEKRAEEDANRTQQAIDNTKNAVERTVDSIKDALSN